VGREQGPHARRARRLVPAQSARTPHAPQQRGPTARPEQSLVCRCFGSSVATPSARHPCRDTRSYPAARSAHGERRTRTADTSIFSGGATSPARHAEPSKKARVCWRFALSPVIAMGRAAGRDTGGYPKMPGGLGRRAGSVGPNETGAVELGCLLAAPSRARGVARRATRTTTKAGPRRPSRAGLSVAAPRLLQPRYTSNSRGGLGRQSMPAFDLRSSCLELIQPLAQLLHFPRDSP